MLEDEENRNVLFCLFMGKGIFMLESTMIIKSADF